MVKAKERLRKPVLKSEAEPEGMTAEELKAFEAKSAPAQALYRAQLAAQDAQDALDAANKAAEQARETAKRDRAIEAGVKRIIAAVRGGELTLEGVPSALRNLAQTQTGSTVFKTDGLTEGVTSLNVTEDEAKAFLPRIEAESKKAAPAGGSGGGVKSIPTPSYSLSHSFALVQKGQLEEPTDGGRPDATLAALFRIYPAISPLVLLPPATEGGRFRIFDGKRRYYLLDEKTSYPAVIVSGFPDEGTQEAAEVAVNRGRTLNVLRAGEVITRSRTRGKSDADIRRTMGFKTGEVDKYAGAFTLPAPLAEALKAGRMTPATALLLAKSSKSVVEAVTRAYEERRKTETAEVPARVTEADVDEARQSAAKSAVERDAQTLTGLTGGVSQEDATGAQSGAQITPDASQAGSASSGATQGESGQTAGQENGLDKSGGAADTAPSWTGAAFDALAEVLDAIPQDAPAPVLPLYNRVREELLALPGAEGAANVPADKPGATFKAPKKAAVENTVEARAGWKASVLSRYKGLRGVIATDAPESLNTALEQFRSAVSSAHAGTNGGASS